MNLKSWILVGILVLVLISTVNAASLVVPAIGDNSDGKLRSSGINATFISLRNGVGTEIQNTTGLISSAGFIADKTTNTYKSVTRFGWCGNASAAGLPAGATVTSGNFSVYAESGTSAMGLGNLSFGIGEFNPTNPLMLSMNDFNKTNFTRYADGHKTWGVNWSGDGWNNYTLNAAGIANVSTSGTTCLMFMAKGDLDNSTSEITNWNSEGYSIVKTYDTNTTGTNNDPILTLEYNVAPTANFTCTPLTGVSLNGVPISISCTDSSTGEPTTWAYYNNSTLVNSTQNGTFTLGKGLHDIKLHANNSVGDDWLNRTGYITITATNTPVASFTKDVSVGVQPLTVEFTDTSTNTPTTWNWSWGDATWTNGTTAAEQNPTKIYSTGGNFTVFLIASNLAGSDQTDNQYVRVYNQTTTVLTQFPLDQDVYLNSPGAVDYYGYTSTNVTNWSWWLDNQWYNGTDSAYYNITYDVDYLSHNYTIILYTSDNGYGVDSVETYYNVTEGVDASFTCTPLVGRPSTTITCTDASTHGATDWAWYNNSTLLGTTQNIAFTLPNGLSDIKLNASHSESYDWLNRTGYINITSADFYCNPLVGTTTTTIVCNESSGYTPTSWAWYNNTTAIGATRNISFTIATVGLQDIKLNATNAGGWDWENKTGYINMTATTPVASFTKSRSIVKVPQLITFTDTSINVPTSWSWNFGDGVTSTLQNPTHSWSRTGYFTVTFISTNAAGSNTSTSTVWVQNPIYGLNIDSSQISYSCEYGTYSVSLELSDYERVMTETKIFKLCEQWL